MNVSLLNFPNPGRQHLNAQGQPALNSQNQPYDVDSPAAVQVGAGFLGSVFGGMVQFTFGWDSNVRGTASLLGRGFQFHESGAGGSDCGEEALKDAGRNRGLLSRSGWLPPRGSALPREERNRTTSKKARRRPEPRRAEGVWRSYLLMRYVRSSMAFLNDSTAKPAW